MMTNKEYRILIVDDDNDDFFLTSELIQEIRNIRFLIEWAPTYDKGIEAVKSDAFDIYFVDYILGAKNGIDFLREAKELGCSKPIIMLTGKGDHTIDLKAIEGGASDYLVKSELDVSKIERSIRYSLERHYASKRIIDNERKFRNIFERSRDIIYITDIEGNFINCNRSIEKSLGYKADEVIGMNMRELYENPENRNKFLELVKEKGEVIGYEKTLIAKDGKKRYCLVSGSIFTDENGETYYQGIIHDITERRKIEQDLSTAEKLAVTGRIVRMIAHEIRNPLTNINLSVEQMESEPCEEEVVKTYLDIIKRNSDRINTLISELLNSSKPAQLNFGKASINEIAEAAIVEVMDRITLKGVQIERNYEGDICDIHVDREKVLIALVNILVNAIEAMEDNRGILSVTTRSENDKCVIEIKDNGKGIDPEILPSIFEPFFSGKAGGTGLGLGTVHNIIRSHNGTIDVASTPGNGALFTLKFDFKRN